MRSLAHTLAIGRPHLCGQFILIVQSHPFVSILHSLLLVPLAIASASVFPFSKRQRLSDVDRLPCSTLLLSLMLVMAPLSSLPLSAIIAGSLIAWLADAQTVYVTQTVFTACECSESLSKSTLMPADIPVSGHQPLPRSFYLIKQSHSQCSLRPLVLSLLRQSFQSWEDLHQA